MMLSSDWTTVKKSIHVDTPDVTPVQTPSGLQTQTWTPSVKQIADRFPGVEPFTRGPYATMYAQRPWTEGIVGSF